MEPLFTFEARVPPDAVALWSLRRIRSHLLWWDANRGGLEFTKTTERG